MTWTHALMLTPERLRRYQRKRMYTRIALGKSSAMDVVGGESSGMPGQLIALLPGLFLLQVWQLFLGANMVVHTGRAIVDSRGWLVRTALCVRGPSHKSQRCNTALLAHGAATVLLLAQNPLRDCWQPCNRA